MTKHTIVFLAANPSGTDPRALESEARAIHQELRRSGYRDCFELVTRWATEPLDLLRDLRALKPTVVHFSGHGGPRGLWFHTAAGGARPVPTAALVEAFDAAGASVRLVVLSACYSEAQADALLARVDHVVGVVGIGGAIQADAARIFAIGFYGGLGEHEPIGVAFKQGQAAIALEGLPDGDRPRLKIRAGIDARSFILPPVAPEAPAAPPPCPYPGMRPYSADTAAHFHGRGAEVGALLGRLHAGARELYVIGPSGSGKSSLVAAGLLPRLRASQLGPFFVRSMRPGEQPTARLFEALEAPEGEREPAAAVAALLEHRAADAFLLLVIDQLEEIFTLADASERASFLDALRALREQHRCVLLFVLRADFYGALMDSPLWVKRRGGLVRVDVAPLRGPALREAIERPSHDLGVSIEHALVERLLADAAAEPGILPLLQETLSQLWNRQQQPRLTLADYEALGEGGRSGLAVALSHRADATLRGLTKPQQAIARRLLLRLVSFGEGRSDTRRQQPCSALRAAAAAPGDFDEVVQRLVEDRLLTVDDDDRVDLAHEVMLTAWPDLAGWIQTRRADEQRRRQLEAAAERWVARGRGARGLLDPIDLAEAEAWQATESARELGQSDDLLRLIAASRAAQDALAAAERAAQGRRQWWRRVAFAALAIISVVIAGLAYTAHREARAAEASRNRAEADRRRAEASDRESQRLLARSYLEAGWQQLLEGHPQEALPYLMAARERGEDGELLRFLIGTATRSLPAIPILEHRAVVSSAAFSLDGTRVVTASSDHTARIWDAATGKPLTAALEHRAAVSSAAFSPDGARLVTASLDGTARVWDAATGRPLTPPLEHRAWVWSAAFSPDGARVVTASLDSTARVWNAATGEPLAILEHRGSVSRAAFSPGGACVVTASDDRTARLWDAATGKPVAPPFLHPAAVTSAAFSPDGTRIITASDDRTTRVWETRLDETASSGWATLAARSPFVLSGGVHARRPSGSALELAARAAPPAIAGPAPTPGASPSPAPPGKAIATSIPQPPTRRAEPTPFAPGQIWSGHYYCAQGKTSLGLQITSVRDTLVQAVFTFSHAESGASGSHRVAGRYDPARRRLDLPPGAWIRRPPGYVMVGLSGTVSADGSTFAGRLPDEGPSSCTCGVARDAADSSTSASAIPDGACSTFTTRRR